MGVNQAGQDGVAITPDDRRGSSFGASHHDILDATIRHDNRGSFQHVSRRGHDPSIQDQEIGRWGHRRRTAARSGKSDRRDNTQRGHRNLCHRSLRGGPFSPTATTESPIDEFALPRRCVTSSIRCPPTEPNTTGGVY